MRPAVPLGCGERSARPSASTGPLPQRTVRATERWAQLRATPDRIPQELQFGTLSDQPPATFLNQISAAEHYPSRPYKILMAVNFLLILRALNHLMGRGAVADRVSISVVL